VTCTQNGRRKRMRLFPYEQTLKKSCVPFLGSHGVGAVGGGLDTDPVAAIADVDAGGVLVAHRQGSELGTGFGVTAGLFGDADDAAEVVGGRLWAWLGSGAVCGCFGLASGHVGLHNG
jgi:hypothetical protein